MSAPPADADTFLAATDLVLALDEALSPLEAGLLAGLHLGLAADTRSFARIVGVPHALVLRALETLSESAEGGRGLVAVTERDARTQRTRYRASEAGEALLSGLPRP